MANLKPVLIPLVSYPVFFREGRLEALLNSAHGRLPLPDTADHPDARQPCETIDEPLIEADVDYFDAYEHLNILPPRACLIRSGVHWRLVEADARLRSLPAPLDGFHLVLLDGYRTVYEQRRLLDHYSADSTAKGYVSRISAEAPRPGHCTGGAVDLTLGYHGLPLALGSDYDDFTPAAHADSHETGFKSALRHTDPDADTERLELYRLHSFQAVRAMRRILSRTLAGVGMVGHSKEWWHFSRGDDFWAGFTGKPAVYEIIEDGRW